MVSRSIVAAIVFALFATASHAQDKGLGLGLMLGEPTGITVKQWIDWDEAWVVGAGVSIDGRDTFHMHVDYLIHHYDVLAPVGFDVPIYTGLGLRFSQDGRDGNIVGVRLPLGLDFFLSAARSDLFVEVAPVFDIAPDFEWSYNMSIGYRFFF